MAENVFISPHLDDAVLSCGELLKQLILERENVSVITIFTGYPAANELSSAAKKYHSNCLLGDDAMDVRKVEDQKAMKFLGCNYKHLNYYECLYRKTSAGAYIYPNLDDIYHLDFDNEKTIFRAICTEMKKICKNISNVYVPYGLGNHADHLLMRRVFDSIKKYINGKVYYYEEIPYLCYYYQNGGSSDFENDLLPEIFHCSEESWRAKLKAIEYYKSQLHIMWNSDEERKNQLLYVSKKYTPAHSIRLWR